MSTRTHRSTWRQLVAFAPLFGGAFIAFGLFQGEPEIALSRNVHLVLVPVCLAGWWVAWRLARVLTLTPVVPIAQAQAGYVALRGTAQPMPNRPPFTSPGGEPCVWYYRSRPSHGSSGYASSDSAQPFLVVDESGQCIVLPAGADITGGHPGTTPGWHEQLIVAGDPIYVAGEFRPLSSETLKQQQDVEPEPVQASVTLRFDSEEAMTAAKGQSEQLLKEALAAKTAAAAIRPAPLALPVVCAPRGHGAFMISSNTDGSSEQSWYGLLARVNLALLLGSAGMLGYLVWAGR